MVYHCFNANRAFAVQTQIKVRTVTHARFAYSHMLFVLAILFPCRFISIGTLYCSCTRQNYYSNMHFEIYNITNVVNVFFFFIGSVPSTRNCIIRFYKNHVNRYIEYICLVLLPKAIYIIQQWINITITFEGYRGKTVVGSPLLFRSWTLSGFPHKP
jgi:hypothetical protein